MNGVQCTLICIHCLSISQKSGNKAGLKECLSVLILRGSENPRRLLLRRKDDSAVAAAYSS